jgi:sulfoxide reductase heme-binding subunit YedZ
LQLIHERQYVPFAVTCALAVIISGVILLITHLFDTPAADVNHIFWNMERAAGFTSYGLLATSVWLGMSSASAVWDRWQLRRVMTVTHQYASLLVAPFLFLHLWGLYMDKTVPFGISQLLLPMLSRYRPIPVAFGVLSFYIWATLIVTSYFREKIGATWWRRIHRLAFAMFLFATLHGLLSGTDSSADWARTVYGVAASGFVFLLVLRVRTKRRLGMTAVRASH